MPPRQDQHGNASRKTLSLFSLLLFTGKAYSLVHLSEILNCSRQTVLRMIEQIERSGEGSIEKWQEGGQNFYRIRAPRQRPRVNVRPEEIEHLVLCRDMLGHLLPQGVRASVEKVTHKTTTLLEDFAQREPALSQLAHAETRGRIDYTPFEPLLEALTRAIRKRQVLEIVYLAPQRTEPKTHEMVPVRIVAFHEALYVRGWRVTERGAPEVVNATMLALHRMQRLTPTRRILPEESCRELPPLDEALHFGVAAANPPFAVTVRFFPPAARYVAERRWSAEQTLTQHPDGSVILELTARSELEVIKWVLGFGCEAECLAPEHLRARIRAEGEIMLERYTRVQA